MSRCSFIPPYLLERVAAMHRDDWAGSCCRGTLAVDSEIRARRSALAGPGPAFPQGPAFGVHDAEYSTELPGRLVRPAGQDPVGDAAVDEAYFGVEASLALFAEVYDRSSFDGQGAPVVATVHYGRSYDNAFWDGRQLVFGDGDGQVFERFTKSVDVLGHEFVHAVTQHTAGFEYADQPGALNESMSDVFAACLRQRLLGQTAEQADWLIGEGIFTPRVNGRALRSMAAPGTAYDDPVLGHDPQVGSMDDYVVTSRDNGGVHINSGIPNRAFHLAAVALGGASWEGPGRIWYAALTSGIGPRAEFAEFAAATVAAAEAVSPAARTAVADAWEQVGVAAGVTVAAGQGVATGGTAPARVAVTRSGGIAGIQQSGEIRLGEDPRSGEVQQLLARVDLRAVHPSRPQPDRFVYAFLVDGEEVVVGEQDLTPELEELAHLVLEPPR